MSVGLSQERLDAKAKVTGRCRFTGDLALPGTRIAKYLHSTIAHGRVVDIDTSEAMSVTGVEAVFTFADIPKIPFATAGHAFNLDPAARDKEDRLLLTDHIRYHGDEIAIVVAVDGLTASKALKKIKVTYEEYPAILNHDQALDEKATELHEGSGNRVGEHNYQCGDVQAAIAEADHSLTGQFQTQMVQHCHMENHIAWAYMDDTDHIVIMSSTQIPHICRRIVSQALDIPMSTIQVIKPAIGGGFGNKQDVVLEPMVAFLTKKLGGVPVMLELTREEGLSSTRIRHPFRVNVDCAVNNDGTLKALAMDVSSNTGGYASHGHSIAKAAGSKVVPLYPNAALSYQAITHYSNLPSAGAMRGYGSPQLVYAVESIMEDAARKLGMDSIDFRMKNVAQTGDTNPLTGKVIESAGIRECLIKGRETFGWDQKKQEHQAFKSGNIRRGLGLACFSYGSGTYPASVEIAGARMILNQDGRVTVQIGATEIGQGSDTVIAQMAAERLGIPVSAIRVVSTQDTDTTPFDPGSFASRQTYIVCQAVAETGDLLRQRILEHASTMLELPAEQLTISKDAVVNGDKTVHLSLNELALDAYYHKTRGQQLTAEVSRKVTTNAYSYGCTLIEVEVDIELCQLSILGIHNIHDSGKIINPDLAAGQVYGGVGMGISGALSEELLADPETGWIYNNNLLDYKIATMMDAPDISCDFVETHEPTAAFGNKSLGEPPLLSVAPAIRNAILDATGVAMNQLPMSPKALFTAFRDAGLLDSVRPQERAHVSH
ncbi:xanthine dehydrogenase subunit XdhA [Endozoicomonas elysicola]|uniref:Xanthine dehydrogenase n=1 Tax=Endozoicomonas elysicola TaxID=305900 RepID=A0A081KGV9_9GAMM|nr:xanthine dehydrogenase subunit XdhA [Endozoicomonas elysicola]KEI73385.1 xanthine dehydrogenase [Endozoicomonas elysicola]